MARSGGRCVEPSDRGRAQVLPGVDIRKTLVRHAFISTVEGPYIYAATYIQNFTFCCKSVPGVEALSSCPPVPGSHFRPPSKALLEVFSFLSPCILSPLAFFFLFSFLGLALWLEPLLKEVSRGTRLTIFNRSRRWRLLHFQDRISNGSGSSTVSRSSSNSSPLGLRVRLTTRLQARWPFMSRTFGQIFASRFRSLSEMSWIITGFVRRNWHRTQSG